MDAASSITAAKSGVIPGGLLRRRAVGRRGMDGLPYSSSRVSTLSVAPSHLSTTPSMPSTCEC